MFTKKMLQTLFSLCLVIMPVLFLRAEQSTFALYGEWLYVMPAMDQPFYLQQGNVAQNARGERVANDQGWHSGYRLEIDYNFHKVPYYATVRWTEFNKLTEYKEQRFSAGQSILSPPPSGIDAAPIFGSLRDQFSYYYLDFLGGHRLVCLPFILSIEGGMRLAKLTFKENATYVGGAGARSINEYSSGLKGIGPEMCVKGCFYLTPAFSAYTYLSFSYLINEVKSLLKHTNTFASNSIISSTESKYWLPEPALDFKIGLSWQHNIEMGARCWRFHVDGGYTVISLFNGINRIYFVDSSNNGQSVDQRMDFILHGPYLKLGMAF